MKKKNQIRPIKDKVSNPSRNKTQTVLAISDTKTLDSYQKSCQGLSNKADYIKTHNLDAKDKVLGRFAAEVAILLQGKNSSCYAPHKDPNVVVIVKNIANIRVTGKKYDGYDGKIYYRHSGYIGNLKKIPYKKIFEKDPKKVLKLAVMGMLPKNRLRAKFIRRLKFD